MGRVLFIFRVVLVVPKVGVLHTLDLLLIASDIASLSGADALRVDLASGGMFADGILSW
jgi:hypothetical protein